MLLRNYDNIMNAIKTNFNFADTSKTFGDSHLTIKVGSSIYPIYNYSNGTRLPFANWGATTGCGFYFGSGTTPVTYDDVALENAYAGDTDYSFVSSSLTHAVTYNEETQCYEHTVQQICTALNDLTINEIGVKSIVYKNLTSSGAVYPLVYREVLETPIMVPTGANFIATFKQIISANPNKPADYVATASVE